jgi:hypothetical protein
MVFVNDSTRLPFRVFIRGNISIKEDTWFIIK